MRGIDLDGHFRPAREGGGGMAPHTHLGARRRDEMIDELSKAKANQPGIAAAVDRYAPQLHRIIQSIDASVSWLAGRCWSLSRSLFAGEGMGEGSVCK